MADHDFDDRFTRLVDDLRRELVPPPAGQIVQRGRRRRNRRRAAVAMSAAGVVAAAAVGATYAWAPSSAALRYTDTPTPTATPTPTVAPTVQPTEPAPPATASPTPSAPPVTQQQLLSAPVPGTCQHPPGRLVDGKQPGIPPHQGETGLAWVGEGAGSPADLTAFGDLTGDGVVDAATVLGCNAGGVGWPEVIVFYTAGPRLLGSVDLGDIHPAGGSIDNAHVWRLRYRDGAVEATWLTQQHGDAASVASVDYKATFRWNGRRFVTSDLTAVNEVPTVVAFLHDVATDPHAAAKLAAPGVAEATRSALNAHPSAATAMPSCKGLNDHDFPDQVSAFLSQQKHWPDRACLLPITDNSGSTYIVLGLNHLLAYAAWRVDWVQVV